MSKYIPVILASALVVVAFMVLVYMNCQATDDKIQTCINLGRDPHECACTFAPATTSYCRSIRR